MTPYLRNETGGLLCTTSSFIIPIKYYKEISQAHAHQLSSVVTIFWNISSHIFSIIIQVPSNCTDITISCTQFSFFPHYSYVALYKQKSLVLGATEMLPVPVISIFPSILIEDFDMDHSLYRYFQMIKCKDFH